MTRFWSEGTNSLRDGVYVSVFPLARWVVNNWWLILAEGLRHPAAIDGGARRHGTIHRSWFQRHNLLGCREGMAYPDMTFFREEDHVAITWFADPDSTTTRGRFIDSGSARAELEQVEATFGTLVASVIERVADIEEDDDVDDLRAAWDAIRGARGDERELCSRMAMLGIDPYDFDIDEALQSELQEVDLAPAVVRDLLAATTPTALKNDLARASQLVGELPSISPPLSVAATSQPGKVDIMPYRAGYARATELREHMKLPADQPVRDLSELANSLFEHFDEQWVDGDSAGVEAAVQRNGTAALVAGQRRPTTKRFLLARALHHWIYAMTPGAWPQRLLTRSGDWQQAASRAFAAELLAPARALQARLQNGADWNHHEELADEFDVSSMVVAHQIENHGLG